jgi:uncharacterized membrane protein YfcA
VLLVAAGLAAGSVNAVAGGGSLLSFPALVATGLPPLAANVTNTVSLWPGYLGSVAAYRVEVRDQRQRAVALAATAVAGGAAGSVVLLTAPDDVFEAIVPALILLACALLAVQPRVAARIAHAAAAGGRSRALDLHAATFLAALYGAYFGGGLGVILLAVLGIFLGDHLQRLNALKAALSLVVNTVALLAFVAFAPVSWTSVAVVAPASLVGGYVGAGFARRLGATALRWTVIGFGVAVAAWLAGR